MDDLPEYPEINKIYSKGEVSRHPRTSWFRLGLDCTRRIEHEPQTVPFIHPFCINGLDHHKERLYCNDDLNAIRACLHHTVSLNSRTKGQLYAIHAFDELLQSGEVSIEYNSVPRVIKILLELLQVNVCLLHSDASSKWIPCYYVLDGACPFTIVMQVSSEGLSMVRPIDIRALSTGFITVRTNPSQFCKLWSNHACIIDRSGTIIQRIPIQTGKNPQVDNGLPFPRSPEECSMPGVSYLHPSYLEYSSPYSGPSPNFRHRYTPDRTSIGVVQTVTRIKKTLEIFHGRVGSLNKPKVIVPTDEHIEYLMPFVLSDPIFPERRFSILITKSDYLLFHPMFFMAYQYISLKNTDRNLIVPSPELISEMCRLVNNPSGDSMNYPFPAMFRTELFCWVLATALSQPRIHDGISQLGLLNCCTDDELQTFQPKILLEAVPFMYVGVIDPNDIPRYHYNLRFPCGMTASPSYKHTYTHKCLQRYYRPK